MTAIERLVERREAMGVTLSFGNVVVTRRSCSATSARRCRTTSRSTSSALDLPETALPHAGAVVRAGRADGARRGRRFGVERLLGALHALEHGQIAVLPLIAMCDRWDIGGLSTNAHPQTGGPTIFIYDGHPGGVGITRAGYRDFERLVGDAHRLDRRVQMQARLPVMRAVAEVRQPERAAVESWGEGAAAAAAERLSDTGRSRADRVRANARVC